MQINQNRVIQDFEDEYNNMGADTEDHQEEPGEDMEDLVETERRQAPF